MHKNCAFYAGIMLNAFGYYAPNYAGIIGVGLALSSNVYAQH